MLHTCKHSLLPSARSCVLLLSCFAGWRRAGAQIGVLAKIESADSISHLEEILDAVDGAMVARGDLGAELPVEQVMRRKGSTSPSSRIILSTA